ncbi:MAG: alcohol dehydrogenase catalytic domain-containing protein [Planctomycetaceae bacterium]|jgi:L-iditol 2-dehydrogenase|nr:alcohol dehydrogenase catalytic domain-containing protein [Planctomycetaceae bacterium]
MREARFTELKKIEITDVAEPNVEKPDEVKVRIDRVGICGSDVHYFVHGRIANRVVRYPATLGHECAGTVVEAGADAGLAPGTRVAIDPALTCGRCDQCRSGRSNTCREIQFLGTPDEAPGAVADYRVLPARNCLPIPDSLSLDEAALIEPLSVGLHSVRLGQLKDGQRVGILGCGPIGLSVLLTARAEAEALTTYVTDLLPERLAVAQTCGADWTGSATDSVVERILEREPLGLDCVFECSGDPVCVDQAMRILTPGGRLVMVGIPTAPQLTFDVHLMRTSELTFRNVRRQEGCMEPAIRMMADGRIDAGPLVTHYFPLEQIEPAFETVAAYDDGVIKAMLVLDEAT